MSKLLISKKGKAPTAQIVLGIIMAVLVLLNLSLMDTGDSLFDEDNIYGTISAFFCAAASVICFITASKYSSAYVNIYDDHIEGKGQMGKGDLRAQTFYFNKGQYNIAVESSAYVHITGNGANYYLCFNANDAQQIYSVANGIPYQPQQPAQPYQPQQPQQPVQKQQNAQYQQASYQSAPEQHSIFYCPSCRTNCRVPAGKGHIIITCPKCGCKFDATT